MIYILGDAAGRNTDPSRPLFIHTSTGAAARLARVLGLTDEEYLLGSVRMNANEPSHTTKQNNERVFQFLEECGNNPFIVLGRNALKRMPESYKDMAFGETRGKVLLLPHTSGVNRIWNDEAVKERLTQIARKHIAWQES